LQKIRTFSIVFAVLLAGGLAGFFIWRSRQMRLTDFLLETSRNKYNVLLITIDTLRADHLGCYGFKEISTPNIDALAAGGIQFADTTAHVPLTLPSHTSIHTGNFPAFHGVHDNGGFYVPKSQITMAKLFKQNGFATAAFVGAYVLDHIWGLNQGFDTYFDNFDLSKERFEEKGISLSGIERKADDVYSNAANWLDHYGGERFFLWTHFYDPHSPYEPPKEWADRYPGRPYIGEIAYTDSVVGKLISYLETHGLRDRTIILLTGDHGESLGEHGESTHAFFVYDATLHVPMILSLPKHELGRRVVLRQSRSIDIAPTLLQLAGVPVPESIQGRSLLHLIFDAGPAAALPSYAECFYPQFHFGWSRLLSLRSGQYKFIDTPRPELYDVKKDPQELQNIYDSHKDLAASMKAQLQAIENTKSAGATMTPGAVDDETHEKLAALGYVGAFAGPVQSDPMKLPDPKDKIDLFNVITSARADSLNGKHEEAISKFKEILLSDPNIVDAHFMLGNEYYKKDDYQEALKEFKKTLELKSDYDFAMINLANTYEKLGKIDEALAGFDFFLKKNPENSQVLHRIGELYLSERNPEKAMEYFQRAFKLDQDKGWIQNSIGVVYLQLKQPDKAEETFHKALEMDPKTTMAHFNLAQMYESQDRSQDAEKEYLAELEVSPKNFKARFNLGRMHLEQGRITEGIQELRKVTENAPEFALGYLFLAQAIVETGSDLDQATELAQKGISLNKDSDYQPLGHLILADIYNRQGRRDLEQQQLLLAHP
jgi:arylsulfatase A-like enzyme/Tfp pilus assembly protein PilF